jgi:hypothetical protein
MSEANSLDLWIVQLDELIGHIQKFVDDNPMEYKGKEKKAYTTGLGMVAILCKRMIEDMIKEKNE